MSTISITFNRLRHYGFKESAIFVLNQIHGVQRSPDDFSGQVFLIFEIIMFCFVVAIYDLLHEVEAVYGLP